MERSVGEVFCKRVAAAVLLAGMLATGSVAAADTETPYGAYLAGRHAQERRDYAAAAAWFEDALKSDPESPELITRTFLMEASEGRFDRARGLAGRGVRVGPAGGGAPL